MPKVTTLRLVLLLALGCIVSSGCNEDDSAVPAGNMLEDLDTVETPPTVNIAPTPATACDNDENTCPEGQRCEGGTCVSAAPLDSDAGGGSDGEPTLIIPTANIGGGVEQPGGVEASDDSAGIHSSTAARGGDDGDAMSAAGGTTAEQGAPRGGHDAAPAAGREMDANTPGLNPLCNDRCSLANNGVCDDSGPDSDSAFCTYGTDCTDCGAREPGDYCAGHNRNCACNDGREANGSLPAASDLECAALTDESDCGRPQRDNPACTSCNTADDCAQWGQDYICLDGRCSPPRCGDDTECSNGACSQDGYCDAQGSTIEDRPCITEIEYMEGQRCADHDDCNGCDGGRNRCLDSGACGIPPDRPAPMGSCNSDIDCINDQRCDITTNLCVECTLNDHCPLPLVCDWATRACIDEANATSQPNQGNCGYPCVTNEDCSGEGACVDAQCTYPDCDDGLSVGGMTPTDLWSDPDTDDACLAANESVFSMQSMAMPIFDQCTVTNTDAAGPGAQINDENLLILPLAEPYDCRAVNVDGDAFCQACANMPHCNQTTGQCDCHEDVDCLNFAPEFPLSQCDTGTCIWRECITDQHCSTEYGYEPGNVCLDERCVWQCSNQIDCVNECGDSAFRCEAGQCTYQDSLTGPSDPICEDTCVDSVFGLDRSALANNGICEERGHPRVTNEICDPGTDCTDCQALPGVAPLGGHDTRPDLGGNDGTQDDDGDASIIRAGNDMLDGADACITQADYAGGQRCREHTDCASCSDGQHRCNTNGLCVHDACVDDDDFSNGERCASHDECIGCLGGANVCDTLTRSCVECETNEHCQALAASGDTLYCTASNYCADCLVDAHCAAGQVCSPAGFCHGDDALTCVLDEQFDNGERCDQDSNCRHCSNGANSCSSYGLCTECTRDAHCPGQACFYIGWCVECTRDEHCITGACDGLTGRCEECIENWHCREGLTCDSLQRCRPN